MWWRIERYNGETREKGGKKEVVEFEENERRKEDNRMAVVSSQGRA